MCHPVASRRRRTFPEGGKKTKKQEMERTGHCLESLKSQALIIKSCVTATSQIVNIDKEFNNNDDDDNKKKNKNNKKWLITTTTMAKTISVTTKTTKTK